MLEKKSYMSVDFSIRTHQKSTMSEPDVKKAESNLLFYRHDDCEILKMYVTGLRRGRTMG